MMSKEDRDLGIQRVMVDMIKKLIQVNKFNTKIPTHINAQNELLKTLRTITMPMSLSGHYYDLEKEYLDYFKKFQNIVDINDVHEVLLNNLYIHQGDITLIKADAIVNAANEKMLGCFIPGHHCIDNAIHLSAGLALRKACYDMMKHQGHDEYVGQGKITKGYNLEAKYVIHTVGPNVYDGKQLSWEEVVVQLKNCYTAILEEANKKKAIKNIVFCSISTGVYGVPISLGAEVAIRTINEFLQTKEHHFERVVIDVFSEEDYYAYKKATAAIKLQK